MGNASSQFLPSQADLDVKQKSPAVQEIAESQSSAVDPSTTAHETTEIPPSSPPNPTTIAKPTTKRPGNPSFGGIGKSKPPRKRGLTAELEHLRRESASLDKQRTQAKRTTLPTPPSTNTPRTHQHTMDEEQPSPAQPAEEPQQVQDSQPSERNHLPSAPSQAQSEPASTAGKKRKRGKGRPSNLGLAPAKTPELGLSANSPVEQEATRTEEGSAVSSKKKKKRKKSSDQMRTKPQAQHKMEPLSSPVGISSTIEPIQAIGTSPRAKRRENRNTLPPEDATATSQRAGEQDSFQFTTRRRKRTSSIVPTTEDAPDTVSKRKMRKEGLAKNGVVSSDGTRQVEKSAPLEDPLQAGDSQRIQDLLNSQLDIEQPETNGAEEGPPKKKTQKKEKSKKVDKKEGKPKRKRTSAFRGDYHEADAFDQFLSDNVSEEDTTNAIIPKRRKAKHPVNSQTARSQHLEEPSIADDNEDYEPDGDLPSDDGDEDAEETVQPKPKKVRKSVASQTPRSPPSEEASAVGDNEDYKPDHDLPSDAAEDAVEDDAEDDAEEPIRPKQKKARKSTASQTPRPRHSEGASGFEDKGPFTDAERDIVDEIFNDTVRNGGLAEQDLRASMKDWRKVGDFKIAVQDALPRRSKPAIRKFCQRRYHEHERGPWTAEQDTALKRAHAVNPDKWQEISTLIGRSAGDCRDRYRNVLLHEETTETGPWSQEEEDMLLAAVEECIDIVKKANKTNKALCNDPSRLNQMVNWNIVAEKMGNKRSSKKCLLKWRTLTQRQANSFEKEYTAVPPSTGLDPVERSKTMRRVEGAYSKFGDGDLYDVLTEIHTAIDDHSKVFAEESTFWSVVALRNPGSHFKSALRRRAFYDMLEHYQGYDKGPLKAASAKAIADDMEKEIGMEKLESSRSFKKAEEKRKESKKRKRSQSANASSSTRKVNPLSNERVEESDDELAGDSTVYD